MIGLSIPNHPGQSSDLINRHRTCQRQRCCNHRRKLTCMLCLHTSHSLGWIRTHRSICHNCLGPIRHNFRRSRRHITRSCTYLETSWSRIHRSICCTPRLQILHIPHSAASDIFHRHTSVIMIRSSSLLRTDRSLHCLPQHRHHKTRSSNCYRRGPIRLISYYGM